MVRTNEVNLWNNYLNRERSILGASEKRTMISLIGTMILIKHPLGRCVNSYLSGREPN